MGGKVLAASVIHILLISEHIIVNVVTAAEAKYDVSFRYTKIPQNFWFSIILKTTSVKSFNECAMWALHHYNMHDGFDYQEGTCHLYLFPVCMDLDNTSGFNKSSQDFGLFTNVRDALPQQRSYHFTQHTTFNLALGKSSQRASHPRPPDFHMDLWGNFRGSSPWKFPHNFPAEIQEK